jgi:hypothetical protein
MILQVRRLEKNRANFIRNLSVFGRRRNCCSNCIRIWASRFRVHLGHMHFLGMVQKFSGFDAFALIFFSFASTQTCCVLTTVKHWRYRVLLHEMGQTTEKSRRSEWRRPDGERTIAWRDGHPSRSTRADSANCHRCQLKFRVLINKQSAVTTMRFLCLYLTSITIG